MFFDLEGSAFGGGGGGTVDVYLNVEDYGAPPALPETQGTPPITFSNGNDPLLADILRSIDAPSEVDDISAWSLPNPSPIIAETGVTQDTRDWYSPIISELGKLAQSGVGLLKSAYGSGTAHSTQRVSTSDILRSTGRATPATQPWSLADVLGLSRLFGGGGGGATASGTGPKPQAGAPSAFNLSALLPWALGAVAVFVAFRVLGKGR